MSNELYKLLEKHFCPDRVLNHAAIIYENDRWSRFSGYKKTADYLAKHFKLYGADETEQIPVPFDGATKLGDWILPLAWEAEEGTLELLNAAGQRLDLLADYKSVPNSLIRWSPGTKPEGEIFELCFMPDARDEKSWAKADVKGKFIFTHSGPDGFVRDNALRRGAAGIVTDFSTAPAEFPKETHWWNTWTSLWGWGMTKQDKPLLGFVLSPDKGRELEKIILAAKKPVKVRARVKAKNYKGATDVVAAAIRGSKYPQREIVFYSHIYECQIDDNAVCAGMQLEMVRTINELIAAGKLPQPERTIRFVMGWEWFGSAYYARNRKRSKEWIASLCYDGAGTKQKYTRAPLCLHLSPGFQTSFADALFVRLWKKYFAAHLPMAAWRTAPWMGGTDTIWIDPMLGDVSNVWPYQTVGPTWHKSHSTFEMIDADVVRHSGLTSLTWALMMANATPDDAERFCKLGMDGIEHETRKYASLFDPDADSIDGSRKRLAADMDYLGFKARVMLKSVSRLGIKNQGNAGRLERRIDGVIAEERIRLEKMLDKKVKALGQWQRECPFDYRREREDMVAGNMVPKSMIQGGLWSQSRFSLEERKKFSGLGFNQLWLFACNGERSLLDIARMTEYDTRRKVNLRNMIKAFEMLNKAAYVRLEYKKVFSRGELADGLRALGVKKGDVVLAHTSLFGFGPVAGGGHAILSALEDAVGKEGTVVLPSFANSTIKDFPEEPYDAAKTSSRVGALTNIFWKRPGVARSLHPSHGLAAGGKYAAWIVEDNLPYPPYDMRGAFGKLYRLDAKILMLGCGLGANSTLHVIEDWCSLPSMQPDIYHYLEGDKRREIRYEKEPFFHRSFYTGSYERLFREHGLIHEGMVGLARSFIMPVRRVLDFGVNEIRQGRFDLLFCRNSACADCSNLRAEIKRNWKFPSKLPARIRELRKMKLT